MKFMPAVLILLVSAAAWGQSFDSVVDFSFELSSFDDPAAVEKVIEDGRIVILEGLMGDTVIENRDEGALVWVTLVGGAWIGTDEVRSYSCQILFEGDRWIDAFPGVKPREPSESYVPQGSRLLVAGRVLGYDGDSGMPTVRMVDYRVLH